jgi:exopolysaccharide biosynthesis polyprenyl glycosylphosphotransferase
MARTLAAVEGLILFAAVSALILGWVQPVLIDWIDVASIFGQALALSACCIVAFYYNDLYDLRIVRTFGDFAIRLLQGFGVAFILLAGFYTLFPNTRIAEGVFFSSFLLIVGLLLPVRAVSYWVMRSQPFQERVLILGTGSLSSRIAMEIDAQPHFRQRVVGVVPEESGAVSSGHTEFGPIEQLAGILGEIRPDRVVVALGERRGRLPVRALLDARLAGVVVEDGTDAYERLTGKLAIEALTPSSLVFSHDFRKSRVDLLAGRALTLGVALAGLPVFLVLCPLIALAIRLDSRGPVLFAQERIGLGGRRFRLLKFRTMHPANGRTSEWVRDNERRVTRVGEHLRRYRLDELPQVLNMLAGTMNLVGPRPHPATNQELFQHMIPYYALRSVVRPGVTGWAQIRYGYANNLEEETEKMRYDLYYIKHLSFWRDVRILVDTVKTVLFGRGAQTTDAYAAPPVATGTSPGAR